MSIGLYMDVHIPKAITNGLRLRGVDVLTAQEDGTITLSDAALLDRATELGRTLYSHDDDVLVEAHTRFSLGKDFAGVIYSPSIDESDWTLHRRFRNYRQNLRTV